MTEACPTEADPVEQALDAAAGDDEPETPAERAAVERARTDVANGRVLTTAELIQTLGL